jgi:hypothetical protein
MLHLASIATLHHLMPEIRLTTLSVDAALLDDEGDAIDGRLLTHLLAFHGAKWRILAPENL